MKTKFKCKGCGRSVDAYFERTGLCINCQNKMHIEGKDKKPSKFKNVKVNVCANCWKEICSCVQGTRKRVWMDSQKEQKRGLELKILEKAGKISGLERQKRIMLVPGQVLTNGPGGKYELSWQTVSGWTKSECQKILGKGYVDICYFQLPVTYKPDFTYIKNGETIHEDVKPSLKFISPRFKKIQKLMKVLGMNLEVYV